jgi:hypothetical protein
MARSRSKRLNWKLTGKAGTGHRRPELLLLSNLFHLQPQAFLQAKLNRVYHPESITCMQHLCVTHVWFAWKLSIWYFIQRDLQLHECSTMEPICRSHVQCTLQTSSFSPLFWDLNHTWECPTTWTCKHELRYSQNNFCMNSFRWKCAGMDAFPVRLYG